MYEPLHPHLDEAHAEPGVLIVDDEPNTLTLIAQLFRRDLPVYTATNGVEALEIVRHRPVGVVVADQRMPGMSGTELLSRVMAYDPDIVRIVLTAYADIDTLMEAINAGRVYQYITKPWDNRELQVVVRTALETFRLRRRNQRLLRENARLVEELRRANAELQRENLDLRQEVQGAYRLDSIIGASPAMQEVKRLVEKAIHSDATVLISGETGTGKEVIARAIHYNSRRRHGRFVAQNCGSVPESLLESELFGHVRGAFTGAVRDRRGLFEEAHGGTIFLDEIGDMSLSMQVKLLRVLEEGEIRRVGGTESIRVDCRVISATHKDLRKEVEAGRFRQDLYYRLHVFPIELPPLREREGDIPLLARHFFEKYAARAAKEIGGISREALEALSCYPFPGNVRQLENEIERAVALAAPGETIGLDLLSPDVAGARNGRSPLPQAGPLKQRLRTIERRVIEYELRRHSGNRTHTAKALGISVRALQKKIQLLGVRG